MWPTETSPSLSLLLSACHCVIVDLLHFEEVYLLATDLLSPGEAGQEYPLPYQQRGPGQVSDYQSRGAHQPNRGKSCWSRNNISTHFTQVSANWLKQPKGFRIASENCFDSLILNQLFHLSVSSDWTVKVKAAKRPSV